MGKDIINIAGDFYISAICSGVKPEQLISNEIKDVFTDSCLNIVNLEAPVCKPQKNHKIIKTGPHLYNAEVSIKVLNYLNVNLLTLANNHIFDYGEQGLSETLTKCKTAGIDYVGAGMSLQEASKIYYKKLQNGVLAIINIAENEWSIASHNRPGANPLDLIHCVHDIREAKMHADFVFIIIHGGHENYKLPSPKMVRLYRFFIDEGADAVIGHHAHCYSGYEVYESSPIIYNLGNFIFPGRNKPRQWYEGNLLNISINEQRELSFQLIPYMQCDNVCNIRMMNEKETEEFYSEVNKLNSIISDDILLAREWNKFLQRKEKYYLRIFSNSHIINSSFFQRFVSKAGLLKYFLHKNYVKSVINAIQCESHHDCVLQILSKYLNKS